MMNSQSIQDRLDEIQRAQTLLAKEETDLLEQLKQLRNVGDPPFCFLYETGNDGELRYREFKSRNLTGAASRMAKFMGQHAWRWDRPRVDYEATFKGEYLDLYALGEGHPLYEYLP